jgi:hypothetical protein
MNEAIEFKLKCGAVMQIDQDHLALAESYSWRCNSRGYAYAKTRRNGKPIGLLFHRLVCEAQKDEEIDHINRNKLDNRLSNLRSVSRSINHLNRGLSTRNKFGCAGICIKRNKWVAEITIDRIRKYLGSYATKEEAINARNLALSAV